MWETYSKKTNSCNDAAFIETRDEVTRRIDDAIREIGRRSTLVSHDGVAWKHENDYLQTISTPPSSIAYVSLFVFSAPVSNLNYVVDVNSRSASVASFFGNNQGTTLYDSALEENGNSFADRTICLFPFVLGNDSTMARLPLTCCTTGPLRITVRNRSFQSESTRPIIDPTRLSAIPISSNALFRSLYVLNKHQIHFKGELPLPHDPETLAVLFSYHRRLSTADDLLIFIMEHELPPSLAAKIGEKGTIFNVYQR